MSTAYYNEIKPYPVSQIQRLADEGWIPQGDIDDRSIEDVQPADIGQGQAHFFAGIAGWPLALRLAGVPDDYPVWTGSCPCQPFSIAGKQRGADDERHLWPEMRRLIAERRPPVIFGEQVASPLGRQWVVHLQADLEALGYAVDRKDLCAAGVGAPHIRQRLWWAAVRVGDGDEFTGRWDARAGIRQEEESASVRRTYRFERDRLESSSSNHDHHPQRSNSRLEHADRPRPPRRAILPQRGSQRQPWPTGVVDQLRDPWGRVDYIYCGDHKVRPIEPGTLPLADGIPNRVAQIEAYGNAIVPQLAAVFIEAVLDSAEEALDTPQAML